MASIFTMIVNGDIPSYKIAENDKFYAFLDINPVQKGHTLVVPKKETDYIFDIEEEELGEMMKFASKVAKSIKKGLECKRVAVVVLGMEVPHAHIHLIPINSEKDANFLAPKLTLAKEEFEAIKSTIELK